MDMKIFVHKLKDLLRDWKIDDLLYNDSIEQALYPRCSAFRSPGFFDHTLLIGQGLDGALSFAAALS